MMLLPVRRQSVWKEGCPYALSTPNEICTRCGQHHNQTYNQKQGITRRQEPHVLSRSPEDRRKRWEPISEALRVMRQNNWSNEQLAKEIGVSVPTVSRWRVGMSNPLNSTLRLVRTWLKLRVEAK